MIGIKGITLSLIKIIIGIDIAISADVFCGLTCNRVRIILGIKDK